MSLYTVELVEGILKVGFGDEASTNAFIVPEASTKAATFKDAVMGKVLRIHGAASMPVAMALSHEFCHIVPALACFDPKLGGYVVCVTHSPDYKLGQII